MSEFAQKMLLYAGAVAIGIASRAILWHADQWQIYTVTVLAVTVWWIAWKLWICKEDRHG